MKKRTAVFVIYVFVTAKANKDEDGRVMYGLCSKKSVLK